MQHSYHSLPKQQLFQEKTEGPSRDLLSASAIQCDTHLDMYQSSAVSFHKCYDIKIMIDQKQLQNVESFKYLGSILTNDGRCTCEIKRRTAMAKAAFNKERALFTSTLDLV